MKLLPPEAPIPELDCGEDEVWDVWEFNSEDEALSKEAEKFGLRVGPPISPAHGWDITNSRHQKALLELQEKHKPRMITMASATRPWGTAIARKDPEARAWLPQREKNHIPLMFSMSNNKMRISV